MSLLISLQQQCAARIQSDPFFANVAVFAEDIGDIQSEIQTALGPLNQSGGKNGLAVVMLTPSANVHFENVFGPFFDEVELVARVIENVPVNQDAATGTMIHAADAAEKICGLLHLFQPDSANGPVVSRRPGIALKPHAEYLTYECAFRASGGLAATLPQAATPVISETSGEVSLACATTGAAIFYTLDGTNPSPRNGTFYTAPFTPGAGRTLNARAWLAGYLTSATATTTT